MTEHRTFLAGSEARHRKGGDRRESLPDLRERAEVTLLLRGAVPAGERAAAVHQLGTLLPRERSYLTYRDLITRHSAMREAMSRAEAFGKSHGLQTVDSHPGRRTVTLRGTLSALERAFGVHFAEYERGGQRYRSYDGAIHLPRELADIVETVVGLDESPAVDRHFGLSPGVAPARGPAQAVFRQVAERYQFPADATGAGQTVALIELGGGVAESDLDQYCRVWGLKKPEVSLEEVAGAKNQPASPAAIREFLTANGITASPQRSGHGAHKQAAQHPSPKMVKEIAFTIETTMDIELVASFANGARIVVYFAPDTFHGKLAAFQAALHDEQNSPSVISCSWGGHEENFTPAHRRALDGIFQEAALRGITVCFSSDDDSDGSTGSSAGQPEVSFPAASPHVLACGGTHLPVQAGKSTVEAVWDEKLKGDLGQRSAGISQMFSKPAWQTQARMNQWATRTGRGVPDVAARADVKYGYDLFIAGSRLAFGGGTSAAAPLWASLVALLNEKLGVTPLLYRSGFQAALYDVTVGRTSAEFRAGPGWDPCTGLGPPRGHALLAALSGRGESKP